jgi:hypothetical protein
MSQAVEAFRQISWLIFKWLLIAAGVLIAVALLLAGGVWGFNWYTHDRHVEQIKVIASTDRNICKDDKFPITVIIRNASGKTVEKVSFSLSARRPGRSSDLTKYNSYDDDHLIEPNKGHGTCWSAPELKELVADPRELQWSINYKSIYLKD